MADGDRLRGPSGQRPNAQRSDAIALLGPPTLGTQRLLAHWAARDGGVKVSEDELLAEVRTVGADEWEQAVAEAERDLPRISNAGPEGERS